MANKRTVVVVGGRSDRRAGRHRPRRRRGRGRRPGPLAERLRVPVAQRVVPVPTGAQRVCPGPLLALAEDSGQATAATSIGSRDRQRRGGIRRGRSRRVSPSRPPTTRKGIDGGGASVISVPAPDDAKDPAACRGSQSAGRRDDTQSGLAVAACTEAVPDAWLMGGSTDIGRTTLVLLSNPPGARHRRPRRLRRVRPRSRPRVDRHPGAAGTRSGRLARRPRTRCRSPRRACHVERAVRWLARCSRAPCAASRPAASTSSGPRPAPTHGAIAGLTLIVTGHLDPCPPGAEEGYSDEQPGLRLLVPGDTGTQATVSVVGEDGARAPRSRSTSSPESPSRLR